MDPLSVAGLALAAIDQLWKISERTAELVSNFRDFDHVSENNFCHRQFGPQLVRRLILLDFYMYG